MTYVVRSVTLADLPLLAVWRRRAHVRRWWGDPASEQEALGLADPRIASWIAEHSGRPFAFVQDYDVHAWPDHPFGHLPAPSRGMDLYIGEPDMTGKGHGTALVRQHVDGLFERGARAVGIDPHPDNIQALRAFRKAGFQSAKGPVQTPWGMAMLMEQHRW